MSKIKAAGQCVSFPVRRSTPVDEAGVVSAMGIFRHLSDFDPVSERNLDVKGRTFYSLPKTMLPVLFGIFARCAIVVGIAFILSKTVPSMPNKVCRFVFLFVLWMPLNSVINYINVWLLGYHKMSWTGALIIGLLVATLFTFWPPQPHKSNTL
jgi:hypothetical protein